MLGRMLSNSVALLCSRVRASAVAILALTAFPAIAQDQIWLHKFGTAEQDELYAAVLDGSGGVFVGGATAGALFAGVGLLWDDDIWLARFDAQGNLLWGTQFGSPWDWDDYLLAAAPDRSGGVFVGGGYGGPDWFDQDAWLARYDSAGTQLWIRYLSTDEMESIAAAAEDGQGGVYVGGSTRGSLAGPSFGSSDAWLGRYDALGNQLWIHQFGTDDFDYASSVSLDRSGGVYVVGRTGDPLGSKDYLWIKRYDASGNELWSRSFGSSDNDVIVAIVPDGLGGAYLAGNTYGNLGGPNAGAYYDAWLARLDPAGNALWLRQFGTSREDFLSAAAPDGAGGVFVGGDTSSNLGGQLSGYYDGWMARFDATGNRLWITQLGAGNYTWLKAATADSSGTLYVGGSTDGNLGGPGAGYDDIWFARYDGWCSPGTSYCTPSLTSIPGCQAAIHGVGFPHIGDPTSYQIGSGNVPGGSLGLCVFGNSGPASTPVGSLGGQICVQSPLYRCNPKKGGGSLGVCNGEFTFTLQELIAVSPIVVAGATLNAQVWARDPANPDGFLLSDGLEFAVCP